MLILKEEDMKTFLSLVRKYYLLMRCWQEIWKGKKDKKESIIFVIAPFSNKKELEESRNEAKELTEYLQEDGFNVKCHEKEAEIPGDDPLYIYERPLWNISLIIDL